MRVVVTDRKYPAIEDPYGNVARAAGADIEYADYADEAAVVEGVEDAAVVLASKAPMTRAVFERARALRAVIRLGTGVDTINLKAATEYGVPVSNTPGRYCAPELATHAIGLAIAAAHDVVVSDRAMRGADGWGRREPITPMNGGTFGIVGLGEIGRAVVPRARGLDMAVIACDPYLPPDVFDALGVERVTFDGLLERSDVVSIHTPLTAETRHRFSTVEFEAMRETAVLVNTARGPIVDERALVDAIEGGEIFAAGLDVFEIEPPPEDSPALGCDRIVCSPHHGGASERSRDRALELVRGELRRALAGDPLQHVVNPGAIQYTDDQLNPERHDWR